MFALNFTLRSLVDLSALVAVNVIPTRMRPRPLDQLVQPLPQPLPQPQSHPQHYVDVVAKISLRAHIPTLVPALERWSLLLASSPSICPNNRKASRTAIQNWILEFTLLEEQKVALALLCLLLWQQRRGR